MARCNTKQMIAAPPGRVWAWFRPERLKRWYGPEIRVISPGPLGQGSRISVLGRSGTKTFGYEAVVTEYTENGSFAWEGADERASYHVVFQLNPRDGGTEVLLQDEFRLRTLMGLLIERLFMKRRVAKYDRHFLTQLRHLLEDGK